MVSNEVSKLVTSTGNIVSFTRPLYRFVTGEARVDFKVEVVLTAIHGPLILEVENQGEWQRVNLPNGSMVKINL